MNAQLDRKTSLLKLVLFFSLLLVLLSLYGLMQSKSNLDVLSAIWLSILGIYIEIFVLAYKCLSEGKSD